jgi:hypothetical protein
MDYGRGCLILGHSRIEQSANGKFASGARRQARDAARRYNVLPNKDFGISPSGCGRFTTHWHELCISPQHPARVKVSANLAAGKASLNNRVVR